MNVMIVEDDYALSAGIVMALKSPELVFIQCYDLKTARKKQEETHLDLVILDINLPDGNGLDYLCEIKKTDGIPVILLTANDLETDIVSGLSLGAEDYVTKPFSLAVLRARVEVQLRKRTKQNVFEIGDYSFDFDALRFIKDGSTIELSKTEQKLLRVLLENRGAVVSREKMLSYVWSEGYDFVEENALSVAIKRLRGKLGDSDYIRTVYGIGYSWGGQKE